MFLLHCPNVLSHHRPIAMGPANQTEISGTWSIKLFFRCLVTVIESGLAHKVGQRLPCSRGWALKMAYEFLGRGAHGLVEHQATGEVLYGLSISSWPDFLRRRTGMCKCKQISSFFPKSLWIIVRYHRNRKPKAWLCR